MGTTVRSELSEKNKYWIERHRYYELKHFCLQYPIWKKAYLALDGLSARPADLALFTTNAHGDPTEKCAMAKLFYSERMDLVTKTASEADHELAGYIVRGVTEGWAYDGLRAKFDIPCCKDTYYDRYRRFFWLLNKERA